MKKSIKWLVSLGIISCLLAGCSNNEKKEESVVTDKLVIEVETKTDVEAKADDDQLVEGMMYSYLTGEVIDQKVGLLRPFAIMVNNVVPALPQSGVSQADLIYEAEVEGGITRLLAVIQDTSNLEKFGTIRSARHYYIDFANDNDALYVHYGQSKFALARMQEENITTIHGISGYETQVFYRSTDRKAPHNVYTTGEMLAKGVEIIGQSREYPDNYEGRFLFSQDEIQLENGKAASKVNIPFDSKPYFTYNTEDGLYYRYQYGEKHIDRENDEQLAFKNIIVQFVAQKSISNEDHQDLTVNGTGKGFYITNGQAVEVTWKRENDQDRTKYYDLDGKEIQLNVGKTCFEIVSDQKEVTFE